MLGHVIDLYNIQLEKMGRFYYDEDTDETIYEFIHVNERNTYSRYGIAAIILSIIYDHSVDLDNSLNINMTRREFEEYVNYTYFQDEGYGNAHRKSKKNRRKNKEKTKKKRRKPNKR